jgi:hypothetical protein
MGDGTDFAGHRDKFELNVPAAGGEAALHFKAHLGDAILAYVDGMFGRTAASPSTAYLTLSRIGGVLFIGELLLVLALTGWSRRTCRFAALALALPLPLAYFGYFEVGYLAASVGAFPLLVLSMSRRSRPLLQGSAGLQGLHAALHGFGLVGIAGGALASLTASRFHRVRWTSLLEYGTFAVAMYLGWVALYTIVFKLSVLVDPAVSAIAVRGWNDAYYFDRRLVHPLSSLRGIAEVGASSLAVGVPVLLLGAVTSPSRMSITRTALAYAIPALVFLVLWWPSLGVNRDLDLLLGACGAGVAGAWLASRRMRSTVIAVGLLALVHVYFWTLIGDRSLDRVWLGE